MTTLHVCPARVDRWALDYSWCPTCQGRRVFWAWAQDYYGWAVTCLTCGEEWTDGEMHERPWAPGWRRRSVAGAERHLRVVLETGRPRG